jgi:hypothetical protein
MCILLKDSEYKDGLILIEDQIDEYPGVDMVLGRLSEAKVIPVPS